MHDGSQKKILLVEDEIIIAMTSQLSLKKFGYEVIAAHSGEKAVETFTNDDSIDLVLMDIDLGKGIDGTEAATAMLSHRDVPIVFMSSHTEPDIVAKTERITSYGYVVKNLSDAVLHTSIKMAFNLFEANRKITQSEIKQKTMLANISDVIAIINVHGMVSYTSPNIQKWFGWEPAEIIGTDAWQSIHPNDVQRVRQLFEPLLKTEHYTRTMEFRYKCRDKRYKTIQLTATNLTGDPMIEGILLNYHDISERKSLEQALESRLVALTLPLDQSDAVQFEDLFDPVTIQRIQDEFATAMGIASIITHPDGTPITRPSNFTRLCSDIIRETEKGRNNCFHSDAELGRTNAEGPTIRPCLSCGLWDAGASITVGNKHVANWLIGQVRDETQTEEKMREYARSIGADASGFIKAFREIPSMTLSHFTAISRNLYTIANQLSQMAYQNVQQARFITDLKNAKTNQFKAEKELQEAYAELTNCQSIAHIGSWKIDLATNAFTVSGEGRRIFGVKDDESPTYEDILACLGDEERLHATQVMQQAIHTGNPYSLEIQLSRKDTGAIRTLVLNAEIIPGPHGKAAAVLGTNQDTTDRKNAEITLWEFGELYRSILNASPDDITITDLEGRILMVSPAALKIFQCGEENLLGHHLFDFIVPEEQARAKATLSHMLTDIRPDPIEFRALHADGSEFDIEVNGEFIRNPEGKPTQLIFIIRDISRRKRAEKEKHDADMLLRTLSVAIDQSPVITVITDTAGNIEFVNPKFSEITGYGPEEVIGKNPNLLKSGFTPESQYRELWETIISGRNWQGTFHNRKKNGELYWESASISPVKNESGTITHFLALKEDITERKLADEKIKSLLSEKELILREVHHRIKNNMSTIYGLLSLQSGTMNDDAAVAALNDAGNRVKSMMLLYTKLYQSSDFNEMSAAAYIPSLIDEIIANFPNRNSVRVVKDIGEFILDTKRLQPLGIIIYELITNIMKYSFGDREDGVIHITAKREGDRVFLTIGDNGSGIPESIDFTKSTGFGLMLISGLTKQLKGIIAIERQNGTRITLEFPATN